MTRRLAATPVVATTRLRRPLRPCDDAWHLPPWPTQTKLPLPRRDAVRRRRLPERRAIVDRWLRDGEPLSLPSHRIKSDDALNSRPGLFLPPSLINRFRLNQETPGACLSEALTNWLCFTLAKKPPVVHASRDSDSHVRRLAGKPEACVRKEPVDNYRNDHDDDV